MNRAHNLPIDDLIQALQTMKIHGYKYVDATVHSDTDIGFKPSDFKDPSPPSLTDLNIKDLV